MSTVQAIDALQQTQPSLYTTQKSDQLGKEDFLMLLITQIQQQDPLNPQDPTEFTAQLAQFGSLEQLMTLNESILDLQTLQSQGQVVEAASFIGKDILYQGDTIQAVGGTENTLNFHLPHATSGTIVTISRGGQVVQTIDAGAMDAGVQQVTWNGMDGLGQTVADGTYTFEITASDTEGNSLEVTPLVQAHVQGVNFETNGVYLDTGDELVDFGSVFSLQESQD